MFIFQFSLANGRILSSRQRAKVQNNDDATVPLGKVPAHAGPTRHKRAPNKANKATRTKSFHGKSKHATSMNREALAFDPSTTQKSKSRANVKDKSSIENSTKPRSSLFFKRMTKRPLEGRRLRRSGVRSGAERRSIRMATSNFANNKTFTVYNSAVNDTTSQDNVQNRSSSFVYKKSHPCNSIHTTAMKYKISNIECRRWRKNNLQQQMNCLGMFNHQYLAASFEEALQFKDLDTGKRLDLSNSFILHRSSYTRQKRDVDIDPGETLISQCHAKKTPTESGHLRICPSCSAITRQPSTPRRFPEYINELLCDPQMESNYLPGIDAFCVQKTFTLDLLQFDGDWELDPALSAEAGHDVYTEKWEPYTQTIRRHCACELLPSSPMATYL